MRQRHRIATARAVGVICAVLAAAGLAGPASALPVSGQVRQVVASGTEITFLGHGWGHGRGMGQYGALGYAVDDAKSYSWILDHYYGGTVAGSVGSTEMTVELLGLSGKPLVVTGAHVYVHTTTAPSVLEDLGTAARFTVLPDGHVRVEKGDSCAPSSWQLVSDATYVVGQTRVQADTGATAVGDLLRVCYPNYELAYRGELSVVGSAAAQMTINHVDTESYLRGVVPRESPASWGDAGGGRGMEALKAQAVAARSYALSGTRPSGAKTCDSTACQVYGGAGIRYPGQAVTSREDARTDQAIAATAGEVRVVPGTSTPVRTEFSSSTGGYTAGGAFPAVEDLGDSVSANPNHDWTTAISTSAVASALGLNGIRSFIVTARNGLGADGGRVTSVSIVDGSGVGHTFTGNEVRSRLGLKSDWFVVSWSSTIEAENVVKALYHDVLGRDVDPTGLATWTDYLIRTGSPRGLAEQIVTSRERMNNLVTAQYRNALHRDPEPAGLDHWVGYLAAGQGIYDLMIGIYGSNESLQTLGGGSVDTWVGAMYEAILGRAASAPERQFWVNYANANGRFAAVAGIARSNEAGLRRLNVYYQAFLQRNVDPSGQATFLPMMTGRGDFDVPVELGSSPEYWSRAQQRGF